MKTLVLCVGVLLLYVSHGLAQSINFQSATPTYPDGSLSHTFTSANTPVSVNVSGNTNRFGNPGGRQTPRPSSTGLYLYTNYSTTAEFVTVTFTFSTTVLGLNFAIFDIDQGASNGDGTYNHTDQVTVSATTAKGVSLTPIIGGNGNTSVSGNTITGTASASGTSNSVSLAGPVSTLTITYTNAASSQADPTSQTITIGTLTWGALPVEVFDFSGKITDNQQVVLSWKTQYDGLLLLEKSKDLVDFQEIFRKNGEEAQRSSVNIEESFVDNQPFSGVNYYRLRTENVEGSFQTFRPIAVFVEKDVSLVLYPNPSDGTGFWVENFEADASTLHLYDLWGIARSFTYQKEANRIHIVPATPLNFGSYWLRTEGRSLLFWVK